MSPSFFLFLPTLGMRLCPIFRDIDPQCYQATKSGDSLPGLCHRAGSSHSDTPNTATNPLTWSSRSRQSRQRSSALEGWPGAPMGHQILPLGDGDQKRLLPSQGGLPGPSPRPVLPDLSAKVMPWAPGHSSPASLRVAVTPAHSQPPPGYL